MSLSYDEMVDYKTIVVRPIPPVIRKNLISALFSQHGAISCDIMKRHSKMRGKVFVHFKEENRALIAREHFNGRWLFNRFLKADFYLKKKILSEEEIIQRFLDKEINIETTSKREIPEISDDIINRIVYLLKKHRSIYEKLVLFLTEKKIPLLPKKLKSSNPADLLNKPKNTNEEHQNLSSDESEIDSESIESLKNKKGRLKKFKIENRKRFYSKNPNDKKISKAKKCKISLLNSQSIHKDLNKNTKRSIVNQKELKELIASFCYVKENEIQSDSKIAKTFSMANQNGIPSKTLYVKNVSEMCEEIDFYGIIRELFVPPFHTEDLKKRVSIRLMKSGRMRNQAFIKFDGLEICSVAKKVLHKLILKDKPLCVEYARQKPE